jgi:branched-chain amino acid transport system ATP-binding protein
LPLLQVDEVSVRFGGVMANQGVNLHADAGRITGLIGPNGAGKTTMFNVITGLQDPTEGRVLVDGKDVTALKPHKRARLGLARTFQRLEVFGSLSARDNVLVAAEIRKRWARDGSDPKAVAEEVLERVGITHVAAERVDAMPTGMARLVELARALAARPRLLLLDEPGSGLDESETEGFGDLLLDLAREGLGMLLVEHDVDLVMRVCDLIFVLDFGRIIAVGTPTEIQQNPDVQAAYLGAEDPDEADHAAEELTHS